MAVGADRQHRPERREGQDGNFWRRLRDDVGNLRQSLLKALHGEMWIGGARDLRRQFHAAVRIGSKVLDRIGKDLVVTHVGAHIVRRIEGGDEQADFVHGSGDAPKP